MTKKKNFVPSYMIPAFEKAGVDPSAIVYAAHTDMEPDGGLSDAYAGVSKDTLYILYGTEGIVRTEGARRIVATYAPKRLETYPLAELGALECEKLLTTGRLWATHGKIKDKSEEIKEKNQKAEAEASDNPDPELLLRFSIGFLPYVERLVKAARNLIDGNDDPLREIVTDDELFCPKCGMRYPEPERKICPKCMDRMSLSWRLLGFFKHFRGRMAIVMSVILLSTAVSIFAPLISSQMLFDDVLTVGGKYYAMVGAIVMVIFGVRFLNTALNILYSYVLARVVPWIVYELKMKIFEAMQRLSVGFYTSKRTGQVMNRVVRDANNIYWFFVDGLPFVIVNGLTFLGVMIVMFILNWKLAIITVSIVPVCVIMFRLLFGFFRRFNHKYWVYGSQLNSMVSDSVNGQRVIKAFAQEDEESDRFSGLGNKEAGTNKLLLNTGFTVFPLIYLFMFLGQVIVTAVGGMMVLHGQMTLGTLLTFIAYLGMLYGPLEFMSSVSNWWARCVDSAQRVFEIIDAKPDVAEPEDPAPVTELKGNIAVKSVWFEYDAATPILKGLDLNVEAGKLLGIVGKTGAGKSTLANLIARLYDVNEGAIEIDGVDVRRIPLKLLRRSIGIVSQEIYLFIGTIADNIRYARPDAPLEDVIRAAKAASAHEFIMNLPDGYETRVGAGGQDLSGGERQRLSIARTIIQNPKILILDEATAAMDTETEAAIQASLAKLQRGRTTIAIAHRLSTLRDADSLAVIDNGKVVESGGHAELMAKKGEYHKLYTIQMEGLKIINMDVNIDEVAS
ncbi:MAG: ABC transporter ATP-binding protein/permease [Defluviitaleaceae bacterium]|nr:ABC transporter ATP-binding protein/permease [Defluviitaleaceae bacterium]